MHQSQAQLEQTAFVSAETRKRLEREMRLNGTVFHTGISPSGPYSHGRNIRNILQFHLGIDPVTFGHRSGHR